MGYGFAEMGGGLEQAGFSGKDDGEGSQARNFGLLPAGTGSHW